MCLQRFSHKSAHSFYFACTCGPKGGCDWPWSANGETGVEQEEGGVRLMAPSCCLPNWVDAGTGAVDVASRRVMATKSLPPANGAAKTDV